MFTRRKRLEKGKYDNKQMVIFCFILLVFSVTVNHQSCNNPFYSSHLERLRYYEDKQIVYDEELPLRDRVQIIDGEDRVFHYYHNVDGHDEEYSEVLVFQIDEDLISFSKQDEELLQLNCYFIRVDDQSNDGAYTINNGKIQGEKENDEIWNIAFDIETGHYDERIDKYITLTESGKFRKIEYSSLWWD